MPDFRCDQPACPHCDNKACRVCDTRPVKEPIVPDKDGNLCPHDWVERHLGMQPLSDRPTAAELIANRRVTEKMPQLTVSDKAATVRVTLADPASVAAFFEMIAKVVRTVSSKEVVVVVTVTAVPADKDEPVPTAG